MNEDPKLVPIVLGTIGALLAGKAVPYSREGTFSAIAKKPVSGPVRIGPNGLECDEQGDPSVHGGADKAVHHYPFDHYDAWRAELGEHTLLERPGAFGENMTSRGVTETDICLGDRLRVGGALLEVSQARQPCWKLNDRFGRRDMARRVQDTLRTGWYYRVLEPGLVQAGDDLVLVARSLPRWSIRRLGELLYEHTLDRDLLEEAASLPLPGSWRKLVETRLAQGRVEDWASRLGGPAR